MAGIEMAGLAVLDIGGYDGRLAYEALRAGAASAVCLDNGEWDRYGWSEPQVKPGVVYKTGDFLTDGEPADVVFCMRVIYHVLDPWKGLQRLKYLTREHLVIQSSFVETPVEHHFHYYLNGSGHENGTVWNRPSRVGLHEALREVGFCRVREIPPLGYQGNDEITYIAERWKQRR